MKKLILALSALLLAVSANAQLGIVAGVTSTKTNLDEAYKDIAETMNVDQYHAGLVYNLNLPLGLSLQPGIIYNMKGQSLASNIDALGAKHDVTINTKTGYLEVPVRVAWGIDLGLFKPYVFAEPCFYRRVADSRRCRDGARQFQTASQHGKGHIWRAETEKILKKSKKSENSYCKREKSVL